MKSKREKIVPIFDLQRQYRFIKEEIDEAIAKVLAKGSFILGEEVEKLEQEFAQYIGVRYGVGVGSGTDAIYLSLLALGVGGGDEIITVPNTAVPTVSAISITGATPVFVDINPYTFTMDVNCLEAIITSKTKAIIPVHLYGNVVDMEPLMKVADKYNLAVIEDACQAHGSEYQGKKAGSIGTLGAFSFYPTKNLGCYGDGGMVVTDDRRLADKIRLLRFYGMENRERYLHTIKGFNSRLDELQAAVLRVKLRHLDSWNNLRREKASLYNQLLPKDFVSVLYEPEYARHVYHLYVIQTEHRNDLRSYLRANNIYTLIHYPLPVHLQPAYSDLCSLDGSFPVAEKCAGKILSLPMFPEIMEEEINYISNLIRSFFEK